MQRVRLTMSAALEGLVDEAVVRRLARDAGAPVLRVYGRAGKPALLKRLPAYNQAAQRSPWLVLVDLDRDAECAPPAQENWLPVPARLMCFRIAVHAVEAWLLADREAIARFLAVPVSRIPLDPESLPRPKQSIVDLARRSRRRDIREDIVPQPESGRLVGPAYTARLIEFTERHWRPDIAAERADSLWRCRVRIRELAAGAT